MSREVHSDNVDRSPDSEKSAVSGKLQSGENIYQERSLEVLNTGFPCAQKVHVTSLVFYQRPALKDQFLLAERNWKRILAFTKWSLLLCFTPFAAVNGFVGTSTVGQQWKPVDLPEVVALLLHSEILILLINLSVFNNYLK